jgi:hypothetical protein
VIALTETTVRQTPRVPWASETLWTSAGFKWLLYAHHEAALYLAGGALIRQLPLVWPRWQARLWAGWDYKCPDEQSYRKYLS